MPQLDTLIFFNQFFWFFIWFFFIYYFFSYFVVPKINFYYFVKYNIKQGFNNLEQQFYIEESVKFFNKQTGIEFSIPYTIVFLKFYKFSNKVLKNSFHYSYFPAIGQINMNILKFYVNSK